MPITTAMLALVVATVAPASDQDADAAALVGRDASGTTIYDFEDDNVEGEVLSPEGANIASRGRVKHASLIQIRPHFLPELIKMANDV
ncbi:MAG: hypothetical protein D6705_02225 [Deltaproteobacteria bacterium]|nr:MAG: hypothetical protein D6705_02225 [Deltaproteobacteria bacterium]